jgi:ATP-dependent Clp protease ATP-binding subunit ClpC
MQGFNFTERVRAVLARTREEAVALNHSYVGTEHMLLGLLESDSGVAGILLENLEVDRSRAAELVRQTVRRKQPSPTRTGPDLPYTSRAKKVLELAMAEARGMNHSYVGTEHLLLGLIAEGEGVAAEVLRSFDVTLERARAEVKRILGVELTQIPTKEPPAGEHPTNVSLVLRYRNGATVTKSFTDASEAASFLAQQ